MAFVLADRVKETTIVVGTGAATLLGASSGYQSFSAGVGASNTTYYTIADQSGSNWEVGYGTLDVTGLILTRTTVISSSNSGSAVTFTTGTKDVWCDYTAKKAAIQDSLGLVTVPVLQTSSTSSVTPVLTFNGATTNYAAGAAVSGSYLQTILQNSSATAGASTNYVLSNNLGTDSTYYGEFGMNSSVYSASTPSDFFSINNGVYFSGHDGDVTVGSGNGFKYYMAWGTAGQSAHVINASGAIGLSTNLGTTPALSGTTGFGTSGQVLTSGGSAAAPTWTTPTTGTVTSVAATVPAFLSVAGSPITSSGTLALSYSGTALPAINGGTGQITYAVGDLLQGAATNTLAKLSAVATGNALISGGVTTASSWGKIGLTTHVSGTLAVGNGGIGVATLSGIAFGNATSAFTAATGAQISTALGATAITGNAANVTGIVLGANGGTGVANTGSTITLGGSVTYSGAFTQTWTRTATTSLTLPVSGTVLSSTTAPAANPITGTPSSSNYLRGDGTWSAVTVAAAGATTQVIYNNAGAYAGSANFTFDGTNVLVAGTVSGGSDERLKTNWRSVQDNYITKLANVKAGIFDRTDLNITQPGVSAQSLREVLSEAVLEDENGMLSVNYGGAALLSVVELAKEVVALRAEIEALKYPRTGA